MSMQRSDCRGFTLLEVLLCVAILSMALVMLYRPLIGSLQAFRTADSRAEARELMEQKIWELREKNREAGSVLAPVSTGELVGRRGSYQSRTEVHRLDSAPGLQEILFSLTWFEAGRPQKIQRNFFLFIPSKYDAK